MQNRDLDKKVFGRDSIFIAMQNQPMGSWLSKTFKKVKKVVTKVIPKPINNALHKFEKNNRQTIKKLGAVAAVGTAAYFGGPYIMSAVKGLGGSAIAQAATGKTAQDIAKQVITSKLTQPQIQQMQQQAQTMTPEQILTDPQYTDIANYAAQYAATQQYQNAPPVDQAAARLLAKEGSVEVAHQTEKTMSFMDKYGKLLIPAGSILAALILKG